MQLSGETRRPAQYGQPVPTTRCLIAACHSCPHEQIHQTEVCEPGTSADGFNEPFIVGCHSEANFGCFDKRLCVAEGRKPAQKGHPIPFERFATTACHSCPLWQIHQTFLLLLTVMSRGDRWAFFVLCHCGTSSGRNVARLVSVVARLPAQ